MSQIKFVKSDYRGVADIPSTLVGEDIVLYDGAQLFLRTVETIGPNTPIPILTSSDIINGIKAMRSMKVPFIYVVDGKVEDTYSLVGKYK